MQPLCAKFAVNVLLLSLLLLCGNVHSKNENSDEEKTHCEPGQYWDFLASICHTIHPKLATGNEARISRSTPAECQTHEVYWPADGKCYALTERGPCSSSKWLVLDRDTDEPICKRRPCIESEVRWPPTGRCVEKEAKICLATEMLIDDNYGEGMCECKSVPKHVFWPSLKACYPMYRQGPCSPGNFVALRKVSSEYEAKCMRNECKQDGMVLFKDACQELDGQKPCQNTYGSLSVNSASLVLECPILIPAAYSLFRVPRLNCEPGSKLDHAGMCKKEWAGK